MLKFLARIFGTQRSGETAKERLKLVLLSDHLSLAPDVVEALKSDLLAVIGKYVEIDTAHVVVDFEHREHEIALTANVPILAMRERPLAAAQPPPANVLSLVPTVAPLQPATATPVTAAAEAASVANRSNDQPSVAPAAAAQVAQAPVELPGVDVVARPVSAPKPRSRRRRRKGGAAPVGTAPLGKAAKA
jgi:cell division topological specificity factor